MRFEEINERIAMIAADTLHNRMDKYKSEIATLPVKKQRGAHISARYLLPPTINEEGDGFYERFTPDTPGFFYWCWYTAVALEFAALLPDFVWSLPSGAVEYLGARNG